MSRVLAQLMGVAEPAFRAQMQNLERAAGMPSADIRLMMEVINQTRDKVRELGLDPRDTTGPELYQALKERLRADEMRARDGLGLKPGAPPEEILEAVKTFLGRLELETQTFAVKQPAVRTMLRKLSPRQTMKKLGYRSLDSMIKHEAPAQLLAAAGIAESREWQRRRLEAYKKLRAVDFEVRRAGFFAPQGKQWPDLARGYVAHHKHNLLAIPEAGAVVLLPLEHDLPGLAITTLLLAVDSLNSMRSLGSYLKLQQVRPDYGAVFVEALTHEPLAAGDLAGEPLPWKLVQWFYGNGRSAYYPEAFQPHVQPEDLTWHQAETVLTRLHPALEFWQGNQLLALLDGPQAVSLNMLDVSLSVCNGLEYGQRLVQHMRGALRQELLARYLHQENLQALLLGQLDAQLAPETSFA